MFKLGWDTAQNTQMFGKQGGGTPHIPIEGIWSDIQARVGTPHKIRKKENQSRSWVGGGWVARFPIVGR